MFNLRRTSSPVRALGASDRMRALELCARDPVASILAAVQVEAFGLHASYGSRLIGVEQDGNVEAICWSGANIVPVGVREQHVAPLHEFLRKQGRRCSSMVGDANQVLPLWEELQHDWPGVREVRRNQPSLALRKSASVTPHPGVRAAKRLDYHMVVPASVAMFTEEVGYDPTRMGRAYEARVEELLRAGRTYILTEPADPQWPEGPQRVVFKADVGALALGVAQLQGVWVAPDMRGRGLATSCLAAVVNQVRDAFAPTVSLYVNDYNTAALALYRKLGFVQVGEYATVLF